MKKRVIKKAFNKAAKKVLKDNAFLKNYNLYNDFLKAILVEKKYLHTTTKGIIFDNGSIKWYVEDIIENIEDNFYNKPIFETLIGTQIK